MTQRLTNLFLLVTLPVTVSCSSLSLRENSVFRGSTLSNLNPAPESMAPPEVGSHGEVLDAVHMRSQADYHYTLAEALSLEGNIERAIEEFKLTLVYDPQSASVRMRLAAEYLKQGLLSEALEQAELAVAADPDLEDGRLLLGGLYSSLKMYDQALAQYRAILEKDPNNLSVPVYIGAVLSEQKKFDEAAAQFERLAQRKDNANPSLAYYYLGRLRTEQGGTEGQALAEKAYVKAISLAPKSEDPVLALAQLYQSQGKDQKALKLVESFQDKFGPNRKVAHRLSQIYLEDEAFDKALVQLEYLEGFEPENINIKVKIALILIEQKRYEQAVEKLEEILRSAPDSDKIRFYLGAVYEELKDAPKAIQHFSAVPSSSNYYADAVIHAAHLQRQSGDMESALRTIRDALAKREDVPQFYAFYASLLDQRKDYRTAVDMLEDAVRRFPEHVQLRFFLGSMYDRINQTRKTLVEMRRVIELDPEHVQALNYLAYTLSELGENLEEAEAMALRALELQPTDGYILDTVGWVKFKKGEYEIAIQYLEAAYKEKPSESIIAEHLGDAYYKFQLVEKAKRMYLRAVAVETDQKKIRALQSKIVAIEKQRSAQPVRQPASLPEQ